MAEKNDNSKAGVNPIDVASLAAGKSSRLKVRVNEHAGHVKLIVRRARQVQIVITSFFLVVMFGSWIFRFLVMQKDPQLDWLNLAWPVISLGLLTIFIGFTEEWDYTPWQSQAQQIEKTNFR